LRKLIRDLINNKTPRTVETESLPPDFIDPLEECEQDKSLDLCSKLPQLLVSCSQSIGKQRDHNEDALFTLNTTLASNEKNVPFGLFVVADGMGGHEQGEIASNIAVRVAATRIIRKILIPLISLAPTAPSASIQEILEQSVLEAHEKILEEVPDSGTTLTILLILDKHMTIAHVGDSRAYIISPDGEIQVKTRDHSLVMRMIELGQITLEDASDHPQRNVLYRALGQGELLPPDINTYPLPDNGYILLCSDGLWGVVPEDKMAELIIDSPDLFITCQRLIDAANEAGGPDNISAILVQIPE